MVDVVPAADLQDMFVPSFVVTETGSAAPAATELIAPLEPKATKPAAETADDPSNK
jgi:hypothetical protein